jgi:hypothetical protein
MAIPEQKASAAKAPIPATNAQCATDLRSCQAIVNAKHTASRELTKVSISPKSEFINHPIAFLP